MSPGQNDKTLKLHSPRNKHTFRTKLAFVVVCIGLCWIASVLSEKSKLRSTRLLHRVTKFTVPHLHDLPPHPKTFAPLKTLQEHLNDDGRSLHNITSNDLLALHSSLLRTESSLRHSLTYIFPQEMHPAKILGKLLDMASLVDQLALLDSDLSAQLDSLNPVILLDTMSYPQSENRAIRSFLTAVTLSARKFQLDVQDYLSKLQSRRLELMAAIDDTGLRYLLSAPRARALGALRSDVNTLDNHIAVTFLLLQLGAEVAIDPRLVRISLFVRRFLEDQHSSREGTIVPIH